MNKGIALILVLGFIVILGTIVISFITLANNELNIARHDGDSLRAFYLAEAGVEKALYELSKDEDYTGESNVSLGSGVYDVSVVTKDSATKGIDATGFIPDKTSPRVTREVLVEAKRWEYSFSIDSALTNEGDVSVKGSAKIDGGDVTGIKYGGTIEIDKPGTVTGNPPTSPGTIPSFNSLFGMTEDQMKALATIYINPKPNEPSPANGIIWVEGDADYTSSKWEGNGLLIVTGDLKMTGGKFKGIIYVMGSAVISGTGGGKGAEKGVEIDGAILVKGTGYYSGNSSIEYDWEYINEGNKYYPYEITKWQELK